MDIVPALLVLGQMVTLDRLPRPHTLSLKGVVYHVQGIDLDDSRLWVTSVDAKSRKGYLHEFSIPGGELLRSVEVQDGARFHPGGIATDSVSIYVPVAEYRRSSTAVIQRRGKRTLALEAQFEVNDHIGCIAVSGDTLIGGNWDSLELYFWDRAGVLKRKVPNPTGNGFQDIKVVEGVLVASGLLKDRTGAIDWLELPSLRTIRRITTGATDRGDPFTREGMTIRDGRLYLLPEDHPSRLFSFELLP